MNIESLTESQRRQRLILFIVCVLAILCGFVCLQYTAAHFIQIKGFALVAFDIFAIIALVAFGTIGWIYTAMPVHIYNKLRKKKRAGFKDWILNRDKDVMLQESKLTRGYALLGLLIASFWAVACIIAQNDVGLALFFALISLSSGTQLQGRLPAYYVYVVSLPIILMFLGSWCHFDSLLPVGIGLFFVNIVAIIIYHIFISKYL